MGQILKLLIPILLAALLSGCATEIRKSFIKSEFYKGDGKTDCSISNMRAFAGTKGQLYISTSRAFYNYKKTDIMWETESYITGLDDFELARKQLLSCSKQGRNSSLIKLVRSCSEDFTTYKTKLVFSSRANPIKGRVYTQTISCNKAGLYSSKDAFDIFKNSQMLKDDYNNILSYNARSIDRIEDDIPTFIMNGLHDEKLLLITSKLIASLGLEKTKMIIWSALQKEGKPYSDDLIFISILNEMALGYSESNQGYDIRIKDPFDLNYLNKNISNGVFLDMINLNFNYASSKDFKYLNEISKIRVIESGIKKGRMYYFDSEVRIPISFINNKISDTEYVHHMNVKYYEKNKNDKSRINNLDHKTQWTIIESVVKEKIIKAELKHPLVRVDYVSTEFAKAYKSNISSDIVVWAGVLRNYKKINKPSLKYFEAQALFDIGRKHDSKIRLDEWLDAYGKKNKWYRKVIALYGSL